MDQALKILVVGDWHSDLHEEAVLNAFKQLGHEPYRFSWHQYFEPKGSFRSITWPVYRAQYKYMAGPAVARINKDVLELSVSIKPDIVFIYRGTHIYATTIQMLRHMVAGVLVVGYNNDDPFAPHYPARQWRHFLEGIPQYDLLLAYRQHNIDEYYAAGAKRVELLRSWFIPERNSPLLLTEADKLRFGSDVVFVGHYENDGRRAALEAICRAGVRLKIFGPEWEAVRQSSPELRRLGPIQAVRGIEYSKALCGSKIALCFLSKLNRDTYTRRCFEIPATNTLMLAEYSPDLANLFAEGEEADFFRNTEDLLQKIAFYLGNDSRRSAVAAAGFRRVWKDGHDAVSRMRQVLGWCRDILSNRA